MIIGCVLGNKMLKITPAAHFKLLGMPVRKMAGTGTMPSHSINGEDKPPPRKMMEKMRQKLMAIMPLATHFKPKMPRA